MTTNTTAQAWRNLGLYGNNYGDSVKLIIAYEAPESVKEELKADGDPLEQKAIGRDALVFIVNEDNPVQSLTLQQLKDIYAGTITNWKDVGGKDQEIIAFQRRADSGSQTLFQKLLIQGGPLMEAPTDFILDVFLIFFHIVPIRVKLSALGLQFVDYFGNMHGILD